MSKNKTKVSVKSMQGKEAAAKVKSNSGLIPSIGIDFGNYRVSAAAYRGDANEIIVNADGDRSTVAVVGFNENGIQLGTPAKAAGARNANNTVYSLRSLFGVAPENAPEHIKNAPFKLCTCEDGFTAFDVTLAGAPHKAVPAQLATLFFKQLREQADGFFGEEVKNCVVSIPVSFGLAQKKILVKSLEDAGFEVKATIAEPLAAAMSFDLDIIDPVQPVKKVIILDVGQYSTDISLVVSDHGILSHEKSVTVNGVGGSQFDEKLFEHFVTTFKRINNLDLTESRRAVLRLTAAVELVKMSLSSTEQSGVQLDGLFEGIDLYSEVTRARFSMLSNPLFSTLTNALEEFIADVKLTETDITHVILAGGASAIPRYTTIVEDLFDAATILKHTQLDETNVYGAAKQAYTLANTSVKQLANKADQVAKAGAVLKSSTDEDKTTVIYDPNYTAPAHALACDYYVSTGNGQLVKAFTENACAPTESYIKFALPKSGAATVNLFRSAGDVATLMGAFEIPAVAGKTVASVKLILSSANDVSAEVAYGASSESFIPRKADYVSIKGSAVANRTVSLANAAKFEQVAKIYDVTNKFAAWKAGHANILKNKNALYLGSFIADVESAIASATRQISAIPTQFSNSSVNNLFDLSEEVVAAIPSSFALEFLYSKIVDAVEELLTARKDGAAYTLERKRIAAAQEARAAAEAEAALRAAQKTLEDEDDDDLDGDDDDDDDFDMDFGMDGGLD